MDAILDGMIQSLRRGEPVDVPPLGMFLLKNRPPQRGRFRLGRHQTLFRQRTKVAFQPTEAWRLVLAHSQRFIEGKSEMTAKRHKEFCCEKCGSTVFAESHFRQYRQIPSSMPGGDLVVLTEGLAIRALICICGQPLRLGRLRRQVPGDQASFEKSFEMEFAVGKLQIPRR